MVVCPRFCLGSPHPGVNANSSVLYVEIEYLAVCSELWDVWYDSVFGVAGGVAEVP